MCQTNKYSRELCRNDIFWMNRTLKKFTQVLKGDIRKYKEIYSKTCREYYIDLINFMEKVYEKK